jgi:hypothetical protein
MTLLSDIVKVLHDAEFAAYSVQSSAHDVPGEPDLVVIIDKDDEYEATDALTAAGLPISAVRLVRHGVIHVWQRRPSD